MGQRMNVWLRVVVVYLSMNVWTTVAFCAKRKRTVLLLTFVLLMVDCAAVFANPCGNNTTGDCYYSTPTNSPSASSNAASTSGAAAHSTSDSASVSGAVSSVGIGPITNAATGGAGGSAAQKQAQQQAQQQQQANQQQTAIQTDTTYQATRIPVATAFAAALTSGQCGVGSTSGGVQTPLIGATFGTTRQDKESKEYCRKVDRVRFGFMVSPVLGCFVMRREFPEIREAMLDAGEDCTPPSPPPPPAPIVQGYTQEQMDQAIAAAVAAVPACPKPLTPKRKPLSKRSDVLTLPNHCTAPTKYIYR